jgi:hypothetical protein
MNIFLAMDERMKYFIKGNGINLKGVGLWRKPLKISLVGAMSPGARSNSCHIKLIVAVEIGAMGLHWSSCSW